ncbi:MAG: two-component system, cell cycle sensor histidine kinase and response regulator CckA [bacterium]
MSSPQLAPPALADEVSTLPVEPAVEIALPAPDETTNLSPLLDLAQELARLGSWELDLRTGMTRWSEGMYRILGIEPDTSERSAEDVLAILHPDDRDAIGVTLRSVSAMPDAIPEERAPAEFRVLRPDGGVREVRAHGVVQRDADGHAVRWIGSVHDVTDQRLHERELRAHHAVSQVLGEWESFEQGAVALLGRVGTALGYPMATLWHWDRDRRAVVSGAFWSAPGVDAEPFASAIRALSFRPGDGKPGRAWLSRSLTVTADIATDPVFRPREAALRQGLRSALAFPAVCDDGPIAVLSFYSFERRVPSPSLERTLTCIGCELGRFLGRRRGELGPRAVSDREIEVLRLAADGHTGPAIAERLVVAPSTIKTHFNNIYAKLGVNDRAAAVAVALRSGLIQ